MYGDHLHKRDSKQDKQDRVADPEEVLDDGVGVAKQPGAEYHMCLGDFLDENVDDEAECGHEDPQHQDEEPVDDVRKEFLVQPLPDPWEGGREGGGEGGRGGGREGGRREGGGEGEEGRGRKGWREDVL